jgi:hypothetical protein
LKLRRVVLGLSCLPIETPSSIAVDHKNISDTSDPDIPIEPPAGGSIPPNTELMLKELCPAKGNDPIDEPIMLCNIRRCCIECDNRLRSGFILYFGFAVFLKRIMDTCTVCSELIVGILHGLGDVEIVELLGA